MADGERPKPKEQVLGEHNRNWLNKTLKKIERSDPIRKALGRSGGKKRG